MKISSLVLFILYTLLMMLPLFSKNVYAKKTRSYLGICLILSITHIILYFIKGSYWWFLLLCLLSFQLYALGNGIVMRKLHMHHQLLRFILGSLIFCLFVV